MPEKSSPFISRPPLISVLMSVYNGADYLEEAVESVLNQDLREIEIILIDDGSTDRSPELLEAFAASDPRVLVDILPENQGIAEALNHGLRHARAPLIARMDADDVALPKRLSTQLAYLDAHPETVICGTGLETIDAAGQSMRSTYRVRDDFCTRWLLRFFPVIPHPTFLFRREPMAGTPIFYDREFETAEDYDFMCRIVAHGQAVCLPDILLKYRVHPKSVTNSKFRHQNQVAKRVAEAYQAAVLPPHLFDDLAPLRRLFFDLPPDGTAELPGAIEGSLRGLSYDRAATPDRSRWLERQWAQHLTWCCSRGKVGKTALMKGLMGRGRGLLAPMAMRFAETKRILPQRMRSDPVL